MKICHLTETLEGASGVATFVRELDASLRARGVESRACNAVEDLGQIDVLHIHGLWLKMYHQAAQWARANGIPVVWSTHGMTAPWSMHHKWCKKLPAWLLYQKRDLMSAVAIHCTTEQEVEWNKSLGFKNCFIAPLGTRLPPIVGVSSSSSRKDDKVLLFVRRIYPVKGLVNLIKAWAIVNSQLPTLNSQDRAIPFSNSNSELELNRPLSNTNSNLQLNHNWKLRIVGPDQAGHQAELEKLVDDLDLRGSVEFFGSKFGEELSREYEECDCLVLPSFTENFGATVVDAMAHGKPIITSTFTPWQEVQARGCGWWVSNEPKQLAGAIREMMSLDDATRRTMGAKGRGLVEEKYTWDAVAETMIAKYREVISR